MAIPSATSFAALPGSRGGLGGLLGACHWNFGTIGKAGGGRELLPWSGIPYQSCHLLCGDDVSRARLKGTLWESFFD